ncbi:hypothetical protein HDV01_006941 [Terramyces sp. JEL0728]|nr:hypothetical protein HDV01_006941 [Terramyces sp. JEL0728]
MLSTVLVYIPVGLFTATFVYNAVMGIIQLKQTLQQKTRSQVLSYLVWSQFLLFCYHTCISASTTAYYQALGYQYLQQLLKYFNVELKSSPSTLFRYPDTFIFGSIVVPENVAAGIQGFFFNTRFSHTLCLLFGITAYFGILRSVDRIAAKAPKLGKDGKDFLHVLFDFIFHIEFLTGCLLWFKYCFHIFIIPSDTGMSFGEAWNLTISHVLAFSIGMFATKDFIRRLQAKKNQESRLKSLYSISAIGILGLRVFWQMLSEHLGIMPPNEILVISLISLSLFVCFPSHQLFAYVVPSLAIFLFSALASQWENIRLGAFGNVVTLAGGMAVGYIIAKMNAPVVEKDVDEKNGSRKHRAWKFPPPYPNGWYRLFSSKEVQPGQVLQKICLGRKFAVFRGEDNEQISVTDAICPHLGANMAVGGRVVGDTLECPFHEWRFGQDGKCVQIPGARVPDNARVKSWPSFEYMGNIYVWYDAENRPPLYDLFRFPQFDQNKMACFGESERKVYLHMQDVAENSADWTHFDVVHSKLHFPILSLFTYIKHTIESVKYEDKPHVLKFTNWAKVYSVFDDTKPCLPDKVYTTVTMCGPSSVMYFQFNTPFGFILMVKTFTPSKALESTMHDTYFAEKSVPSLLVWYILREAKFAFGEDIEIWNHKEYPRSPILIRDDKQIKEFRRWYKQFYSESSRQESGINPDNIEYEEDSCAAIRTKQREVVLGCSDYSGLEW